MLENLLNLRRPDGELCSFGHKLECLKEHSIPASRRRN
jgi:hypothetical protein